MKKMLVLIAMLAATFAAPVIAQDKAAPTVAAPAATAPAAAPAAAPSATAAPAPTPNKGDVAWMLTSTAFVLLMSVPALGLFYGGLVRSKNVLSVLMQVFVVFSLITVLWCVYGYSLAFTEGNAYFGSFDRLFLKGTFDSAKGEYAMAANVAWNATNTSSGSTTPLLNVAALANSPFAASNVPERNNRLKPPKNAFPSVNARL
jgi:Amt family ammonium transporter